MDQQNPPGLQGRHKTMLNQQLYNQLSSSHTERVLVPSRIKPTSEFLQMFPERLVNVKSIWTSCSLDGSTPADTWNTDDQSPARLSSLVSVMMRFCFSLIQLSDVWSGPAVIFTDKLHLKTWDGVTENRTAGFWCWVISDYRPAAALISSSVYSVELKRFVSGSVEVLLLSQTFHRDFSNKLTVASHVVALQARHADASSSSHSRPSNSCRFNTFTEVTQTLFMSLWYRTLDRR